MLSQPMKSFNVNPHIFHQNLLKLLLLLVVDFVTFIEDAKTGEMVFERQLLSGFPICGEVGGEADGVDVGLQLHDIGGGEVAEEGEAAEHRWPRVLGAQGDEVGPWNVSRIGEVLQQGDDWLVEAWIAENLLSVGVDVVVYEVENCDKFPGL